MRRSRRGRWHRGSYPALALTLCAVSVWPGLLAHGAETPRLTFAQAPTQEIRRKARGPGGMRTLLDDGIMKVLKGSTTLDEVLSTCHHGEE